MATPRRHRITFFSVVVTVAILGGAYATDYGAAGFVKSKSQDSGGSYVTVVSELGDFNVKKYLPILDWSAVQVGNYVVYHIRSGLTELYDSKGGTLIYRG